MTSNARAMLLHDFQKYARSFGHLSEDLRLKRAGKVSPERVHRLRVTLRHLRSDLGFLKYVKERRQSMKLSRRFHKWSRALGVIRELDVGAVDCRAFQIDVQKLVHKRRKVCKKFCRSFSKWQADDFHNLLEESAEEIQNISEAELRKSVRLLSYKLKRWGVWIEKLSGAGTRWDLSLQVQKFHELRIQVKKARYFIEALGHPSRDLQKLQDVLGRLHDLEVAQKKFLRNVELSSTAKSLKHRKIDRQKEVLASRAVKLAKPVIKSTCRYLLKTDRRLLQKTI